MRVVTKEEFFSYVNQRDVVASHDSATYSTWETRGRVEIGRTYPGWKNPGDEKIYMLIQEAYKEVKKE